MEDQEPDPASHHQRSVLISALALTAICTQLTTIMSVQHATSGSVEEKAKVARWNDTEITKLVEYLWEHRAEGGDGGTFKPPTFNAAARHIAEYRTSGAVKTAKHLKTKWSSVSCSCSDSFIKLFLISFI